MAEGKAKQVTGARAPRPRKPTYYHLSEKDHAVIKDGLRKFAPVYTIALKIGCGYSTLCQYIKAHPDLLDAQKEANDNVVNFTFGKLMQKVSKGNVMSIMFLLERLDPKRFGKRQVVENVGDLPTINIGTFKTEDEVKPIDPAEVGNTAGDILDGAIKLAEEKEAAE